MASEELWKRLEKEPRYTDSDYENEEHVQEEDKHVSEDVHVLEDGTKVIMMHKENIVNVYVGTITALGPPVSGWGEIQKHEVDVEMVEEGIPCKHYVNWSLEETPDGNLVPPGNKVRVPVPALKMLTHEQYELGKHSPGAVFETGEFSRERPKLHSKVLFTGPLVQKHNYYFGTITGSRRQRMSGYGGGGWYAVYDVTTADGNVFKNVNYDKVKRAPREGGGGAVVPASGLQERVHKIRTALNITVPAEQLFNVVTEANSKLGLIGDGTLPEQIAEVERILFGYVSSSFADICIV